MHIAVPLLAGGATRVGDLDARDLQVEVPNQHGGTSRLTIASQHLHVVTKPNAAANEAAGEERVRALPADATDLEAMSAAVERAEEWGDLAAIVANAGVIAGGLPAWDLPQDQEDAVLDTCLACPLAGGSNRLGRRQVAHETNQNGYRGSRQACRMRREV